MLLLVVVALNQPQQHKPVLRVSGGTYLIGLWSTDQLLTLLNNLSLWFSEGSVLLPLTLLGLAGL